MQKGLLEPMASCWPPVATDPRTLSADSANFICYFVL
jgi:hypothetical protein